MDRDAHPPASAADAVPPFEWAAVRKVGAVGLGLLAGAAGLGLIATAIDVHWAVHTARLFLVLFGTLAVGAAVSMRPDLWQAWALGAIGAAVAVVGTPGHWDSFRLLFLVLAAVAVARAGLLAAPPRYRLPVISALVLFHFGGIFFATTTPPSTPWVTEQAFVRIYNPYLQFVYLRNAYHFYSPQPGPASLLIFMIKTEVGADPATGEKKYETKWIAMPKRPNDVLDPLGLTYYRRLSITEQLARGSPGLRAGSFELAEMRPRRVQTPIPLHPGDEFEGQYILPNPDVVRYVLPSYAQHVILENMPNNAEVLRKTTVKIYRVQHNTLSVEEYINALKRPGVITNPYHPTTYRPYFLGEFNVRGDLINPQESMLYWLVPILPRPGGVPPGATNKREYIDWMSFHALGPDVLGMETTADDLGKAEFKDRVFDWDQLR